MKRILIAAASAVAMVCTTFADATTWFDTKIQDLTAWPTNNASEFGGTWFNRDSATRLPDYDGTNALEVAAATNAPLTFTASTTNLFAGATMVFTSKIEFTPFNYDEMPEVPENAKGGVIAVRKNGVSKWYVLAKADENDNTNAWVNTGIDATNIAVEVTTKLAREEIKEGEGNYANYVTYTIGEYARTRDLIVVNDTNTVATVSYTGDGVVASLSATAVRRLVEDFTVPETIKYGDDTYGITDITVYTNKNNWTDMGTDRTAYYGDSLKIVYRADEGQLFSNGTNVIEWTGVVTDGEIPTELNKYELFDAEAKIGTVLYLTLQGAVDAASYGDTVVVCGDLEKDAAICVTNNPVTIDFDTRTLISSGDWAIMATVDLVLSNAENNITASNGGVIVTNAAALALYNTKITAAGRAVEITYDSSDYKPGAFFVDQASTITSTAAEGFYCANANCADEDTYRVVTINGKVYSAKGNALLGYNNAVINGTLSDSTWTNTLYYCGSYGIQWYTPTLEVNGTITNGTSTNSYRKCCYAILTDAKDEVGIELTFGKNANIISKDIAIGWYADYDYPYITIANGTFDGTIDVLRDEDGDLIATEFISGGKFSFDPEEYEDGAYLEEDAEVEKKGDWYVVNGGEEPEPTTCTFTLTPTVTGADVAVYTNDVEITAGASGYTVLEGADDITIVYTAKDGKLFSDGSNKLTVEKTTDDISEGVIDVTDDVEEPKDAEAKIGTTYYLTLQKALDAANTDDKVTLCADIETASAQQWTIAKNITIDFATYTITKTVANDWVFTIAKDANVTFTGTTGGIIHYPAVLNQGNPASMIQILGKLTVSGGVYESDYTVFKVDEDDAATHTAKGELVVNGGTFTIAPREGTTYTGQTFAVMNWSKATINGGAFTGRVVTLSNDGNKCSKAGETIIGEDFTGTPTYVLKVSGSTYANVPKIKGVAKANVTLVYDTTKITDELELVEKDGYVTVAKVAPTTYDITITEPANGTLETSVTNGVAAGTTVTVTATPAQGYELETITTNGTAITGTTFDMPAENVTVAATFKAKGGDAPTPASGSETKVEPVAGEENTYKVEPTGTGTTVAVDNVKDGDTLVVSATVTEVGVNGGESAGATIKVMNSDNSAEVPTSAMKGWTGNTFDTALDATKTVEVETSEGTVTVPVEPTLIEETATEKPLVVGDNVETTVQAIPGLTYKLVRDDAPGGSFETVAASDKGESGKATITLKDTDKPADKAFYKVQVTK